LPPKDRELWNSQHHAQSVQEIPYNFKSLLLRCRKVPVSPWQPNRGETTLRVVVPSAALRHGRHVLVVEAQAAAGEEPVESYAFRVRRR
jgi:hypothetical protein